MKIRAGKRTIGQRNFFLPEMNSQSKSRETNHSHLKVCFNVNDL